MGALTLTALPGIPMVGPGDDVAGLIETALASAGLVLADGDLLVVAHKIISKAEGRLVRLAEVRPGTRARALADETGKDARHIQVVLDEARRVERSKPGVIVTEHLQGWVVANSAVDRSNVEAVGGEEQVLLLPVDPDGSALRLRDRLAATSGTRLAVIINDTHGRPFRRGAVGVAIGVAGLRPLVDLRGREDLFGYTLRGTDSAVADELAAAASLLQGQTDEGTPVVHLRGYPYVVDERATARDLQRPFDEDMFRYR